MGQRVKANWEFYTDEELKGGAERFGLTVQQERQRMRLVQSDCTQWPLALRRFITEKQKSYNGLEFVGFTVFNKLVIDWLKEGNTVSLDGSVELSPVVQRSEAVAAAA
jgi:hypothetical protein